MAGKKKMAMSDAMAFHVQSTRWISCRTDTWRLACCMEEAEALRFLCVTYFAHSILTIVHTMCATFQTPPHPPQVSNSLIAHVFCSKHDVNAVSKTVRDRSPACFGLSFHVE